MLLHELERAVLNRHRERERLVVVVVDVLERVGEEAAAFHRSLARDGDGAVGADERDGGCSHVALRSASVVARKFAVKAPRGLGELGSNPAPLQINRSAAPRRQLRPAR